MPDDAKRYEFVSVHVIRGREAGTIAKRINEGWELDKQSQGTLRTELTFRRVKPKSPLLAFVASAWAAFRRLKPETQRRLALVSGGVAMLVIFTGIFVGLLSGGGSSEPKTPPTAAADAPSARPTEVPAPAPKVSAPEAVAYNYSGPVYEIVSTDRNQGCCRPRR